MLMLCGSVCVEASQTSEMKNGYWKIYKIEFIQFMRLKIHKNWKEQKKTMKERFFSITWFTWRARFIMRVLITAGTSFMFGCMTYNCRCSLLRDTHSRCRACSTRLELRCDFWRVRRGPCYKSQANSDTALFRKKNLLYLPESPVALDSPWSPW